MVVCGSSVLVGAGVWDVSPSVADATGYTPLLCSLSEVQFSCLQHYHTRQSSPRQNHLVFISSLQRQAMHDVKKAVREVPLFCDGLRILRCHSCGAGRSCGPGLIPSARLSACCGHGQKTALRRYKVIWFKLCYGPGEANPEKSPLNFSACDVSMYIYTSRRLHLETEFPFPSKGQ